ncbi:MAG: asparagine synthase (glutamine-hydrolyzing), partial [Alphaproteobacteria bacterium]
MCGIAGWICDSGQAPPQRQLVAMTSAIQHRGPDDSGHFHTQTTDGRHRIAMGFRRLSIIDIAGGSQPMHDPSSDVTIIYNGEIYNFQELRRQLEAAGHSFRTRSDTEVILHAYKQYGETFVTKLRGMFAIAIWDRPQQRLILARDPFGKKPLFLHQRGQNLFFASEIKSLLVNPEIKASVNIGAVWDYLSYRYVPGPATLFEGITKLPPGSLAIWQHGRLSTQRYYTPPDAREERPKLPPGADPVDAFLVELEEAVRIRMIADVPVGAFLSGGIDSSAV